MKYQNEIMCYLNFLLSWKIYRYTRRTIYLPLTIYVPFKIQTKTNKKKIVQLKETPKKKTCINKEQLFYSFCVFVHSWIVNCNFMHIFCRWHSIVCAVFFFFFFFCRSLSAATTSKQSLDKMWCDCKLKCGWIMLRMTCRLRAL